MTPGAYLRKRREAAGLTLEDVAIRVGTMPPVSARTRGEWLATIEADAAPIAIATAFALRDCFRFDPHVLDALITLHAGHLATEPAMPQLCRECGCSWHDPCLGRDLTGCAWVAGDPTLCTAHAASPALSAAA